MPGITLRRVQVAAALSLTSALASCSSDTLEPTGRLLLGTWGSSDAELVAIQAGAEVRFGCSSIVIHSPISLSETNSFNARGELHGSGMRIGGFPLVNVTGSVDGDQVRLTAPSAAGDPLATYVLEAGVTLPPSEVPECPQ